MNNFLRILKYLLPYKANIILNLIFNLLSIIFSLVSIVMLIPFLQLLFGKIPPVTREPQFSFSPEFIVTLFEFYLSKIIKQSGPEQGLLFICVCTAAIFFLKNLFRFLAVYVMSAVRNGVVRDLRNDLYSKILSLPLS
ncbi:MAG: ABC transporter ATP-binding protein, partial [Chitinophagales bacterium]|nr:ABC transporter ATP-binding protein [Chitinophagales bacterium]